MLYLYKLSNRLLIVFIVCLLLGLFLSIIFSKSMSIQEIIASPWIQFFSVTAGASLILSIAFKKIARDVS